MLAFGYLMIMAGYLAYPFATSVLMLTMFRAIFAVGAAAVICTFTTVLTDYPQEMSRGKLVALGSVLNAFGLAILAGRWRTGHQLADQVRVSIRSAQDAWRSSA